MRIRFIAIEAIETGICEWQGTVAKETMWVMFAALAFEGNYYRGEGGDGGVWWQLIGVCYSVLIDAKSVGDGLECVAIGRGISK